jgi:hypothetical protein
MQPVKMAKTLKCSRPERLVAKKSGTPTHPQQKLQLAQSEAKHNPASSATLAFFRPPVKLSGRPPERAAVLAS